MKDKIILTAFLAVIMTAVPLMFIKKQEEEKPYLPQEQEEKQDIVFNVYNCETGETMELNGREYIVYVVAGEMPASFEDEALKAQAVAAFTYAYRRKISNSADKKHIGAELCTDSSHCKAFSDKEEMKERWGDEYEKNFKKITDAVNSVYGEYMIYGGKPIDAVFHSLSSGNTEAAEDVWGNKIPYLLSVESPDGNSENALSRVEFTKSEFKNIVKAFNEEAEFDGDEKEWLSNITRSESGGIITAELCGIPVSGRSIRKLFNLRSTNFELVYEDGNFVFTVKGYGHGVGMSQYGANLLAQEGKTYREILSHYYTDIEFTEIKMEF